MKRRLLNTPHRYGFISIILHWITVPWVLFLLVSGLWMTGLSYYDPWYTTLPYWHKLLGFLLVILLGIRTVWRIVSPPPPPLVASRTQRIAARMAHLSFYVVLWSLCLTGYLFLSASGTPIAVTSSLALGVLYVPSEASASWAGRLHEWLGYAVAGLTLMHAAAAVKHHFIDRDMTLTRIINPRTKA